MTTRRHLLLTGAALGLAASPLAAFAAGGEGVTDTRLAKLLDAFVDEILADSPQTASSIGKDKGPRAVLKRRLDDLSAAGRTRQGPRPMPSGPSACAPSPGPASRGAI